MHFLNWWSVGDSRCSALWAPQLKSLAGLVQAGFDHGLLDSPPDCLAYGHALPGSNPPDILQDRKTDSQMAVCFSMVERRGFEPLTPTLPVWCAPSCANAPREQIGL